MVTVNRFVVTSVTITLSNLVIHGPQSSTDFPSRDSGGLTGTGLLSLANENSRDRWLRVLTKCFILD